VNGNGGVVVTRARQRWKKAGVLTRAMVRFKSSGALRARRRVYDIARTDGGRASKGSDRGSDGGGGGEGDFNSFAGGAAREGGNVGVRGQRARRGGWGDGGNDRSKPPSSAASTGSGAATKRALSRSPAGGGGDKDGEEGGGNGGGRRNGGSESPFDAGKKMVFSDAVRRTDTSELDDLLAAEGADGGAEGGGAYGGMGRGGYDRYGQGRPVRLVSEGGGARGGNHVGLRPQPKAIVALGADGGSGGEELLIARSRSDGTYGAYGAATTTRGAQHGFAGAGANAASPPLAPSSSSRFKGNLSSRAAPPGRSGAASSFSARRRVSPMKAPGGGGGGAIGSGVGSGVGSGGGRESEMDLDALRIDTGRRRMGGAGRRAGGRKSSNDPHSANAIVSGQSASTSGFAVGGTGGGGGSTGGVTPKGMGMGRLTLSSMRRDNDNRGREGGSGGGGEGGGMVPVSSPLLAPKAPPDRSPRSPLGLGLGMNDSPLGGGHRTREAFSKAGKHSICNSIDFSDVGPAGRGGRGGGGGGAGGGGGGGGRGMASPSILASSPLLQRHKAKSVGSPSLGSPNAPRMRTGNGGQSGGHQEGAQSVSPRGAVRKATTAAAMRRFPSLDQG
jgi:hypothetical protein